MSGKVRAKFVVDSVSLFRHGGEVVLTPVLNDREDNRSFWEATPSGQIKMYITTDALDSFKPEREFYVDFTLVDPVKGADEE